MRKFLVPFLYSLLSLFISMNFLQLYYDNRIIEGETVSIIFDNLFNNMMQITVVVAGVGTPIVLAGCILGELLFKYFILLFDLNYIISLVLYILLGVGIILVLGFIIAGRVQIVSDDIKFTIMTVICSVTFFVSRNEYEKKT
ncbi:hypothetical protein EXW50_29475 (plasmid) [Bacillus mycoides]|uniref:hypothetical protein n=1 Tax=Bacillus mycoides TaxID=1405 RepID=UPI001C028C03|nr:hypothetical protein [Bacillus mycoides]QWG76030.1 hypothetical protein EXW63_29045 [Bacillus mycoides]QWH26415.1 hypothetical protein EXW50_29475 [Bacillus mycoides]